MSNVYDKGDLVKVKATFTDTDGAAIDPTTVKLTHKSPGGTTTTWIYNTNAEVVRDAAGVYHADIDANAPGWWHYRWFSTGTGQAAAEGSFYVRPTNV